MAENKLSITRHSSSNVHFLPQKSQVVLAAAVFRAFEHVKVSG
jgi:hypothetical protein